MTRRKKASWKTIGWLAVAAGVVLGVAWFSLPDDYWGWLKTQITSRATTTVKGCCYVGSLIEGEKTAISNVTDEECRQKTKERLKQLSEREKKARAKKGFLWVYHDPGLFVPGKCETNFELATCEAAGGSDDKPPGCYAVTSPGAPQIERGDPTPVLRETCNKQLSEKLTAVKKACEKEGKIFQIITGPQLTWELQCLVESTKIPTPKENFGLVYRCEQEWAMIFQCVTPPPATTQPVESGSRGVSPTESPAPPGPVKVGEEPRPSIPKADPTPLPIPPALEYP